MGNPSDVLDAYRESVPKTVKECIECKASFETKIGTFCSSTCKSKHHKEKKRLEKIKELVCHFCGGAITEKRKTKFCCKEHKNKFFEAKRTGKKIAIKVNEKTTIFTDKYDRIPEILANYKVAAEDMTKGGGGGFSAGPVKIGGAYITGDIH
jgi:hypothetical protein